MVINPLCKGGKGLTPEIIVTAPSGSTLDIMQNSVVLQTYTLGSSETSHTFAVESVGEYVVRGTSGTKTKSETVSVDSVGQYEVTIEYFSGLKLYWYGDECESVTGGWVTGRYQEGGASYITKGTGVKNSNNLYMYVSTNNTSVSFGTVNLIDVTKYSTIKISYTSNNGLPYVSLRTGEYFATNKYDSTGQDIELSSSSTLKQTSASITVTSSKKVMFGCMGYDGKYYPGYLTVYAVWLE